MYPPTVFQGEEIADSLRHIADLDDFSPQVAVLDIVEQQVHSLPEKEITPELLSQLVSDFKQGLLQFRPISSWGLISHLSSVIIHSV